MVRADAREFPFSLKMPREITHERSLDDTTEPLVEEFIERVSLLKDKLGVILIQLPAAFEAVRENAQSVRRFLAPAAQLSLCDRISACGMVQRLDLRRAWRGRRNALGLVEGKWVQRELMFASLVKLAPRFEYLRFMGERDLEHSTRFIANATKRSNIGPR